MSILCGRADSQVLLRRRPWRSHSCSSLRNRRSLSPTAENCGFYAVAVHQGRCLPVATPRLLPMVLAIIKTSQLLFVTVVSAPVMQVVQGFSPVVAPRLTHMVLTVQQTMGGSPVAWTRWSMPLLCRSFTRLLFATTSRRHSCRDAEAVSHGPAYFADHCVSPAAIH